MIQEDLLKNLISFYVGGGWGEDQAFDNCEKMNVIRGTDFEDIKKAKTNKVPVRYDRASKIKNRILEEGDLVLEISGGSAINEQYVGRTLFITKEILELFEYKVIPASFCKLIRFKKKLIDPQFAFYYFEFLYLRHLISIYEVQSTGLSNFQFEDFINQEKIKYPKNIEDQKKMISEINKIDKHFFSLNDFANKKQNLRNALIQKLFLEINKKE